METNYSQYEEQKYILEYFGNYIGSCLDVGASDGVDYSNVYQLLLDGWHGVSVEPATQTFTKLVNNYSQFGTRSELVLAVIDQNPGFVTFYENHQLSTTSVKHMAEWEWHRIEHGYDWLPVTHYAITLNSLLQNYISRNFDFISIDLEGQTNSVVCSTDWNLAPNCKLLCIEHDQNWDPLIAYLEPFGFKFYHKTSVNLLMSR